MVYTCSWGCDAYQQCFLPVLFLEPIVLVLLLLLSVCGSSGCSIRRRWPGQLVTHICTIPLVPLFLLRAQPKLLACARCWRRDFCVRMEKMGRSITCT